MIPKVIHYCWFGRHPLPPLAEKCIASWKEYLPDYEIKEWNEDNFDVDAIAYTRDAYKEGKYAFVSDYARFWILYHHGGLYFDTDVEIIKGMDDIVERGAFMGCEADDLSGAKVVKVAPGLCLGAPAGDPIYAAILKVYASLSFYKSDGSLNLRTIVEYTTDTLQQFGFKEITGIQQVGTITIYPSDYFNPQHYVTKRIHITANTRSIHYGASSWSDSSQVVMLKKRLRMLLPEWLLLLFNRLKNR